MLLKSEHLVLSSLIIRVGNPLSKKHRVIAERGELRVWWQFSFPTSLRLSPGGYSL